MENKAKYDALKFTPIEEVTSDKMKISNLSVEVNTENVVNKMKVLEKQAKLTALAVEELQKAMDDFTIDNFSVGRVDDIGE